MSKNEWAAPAAQSAGAQPDEEKYLPGTSNVLRKVFLPLCWLFLSLAGCGTKEIRPVDLLPEDVCANCKMAISQKAYAAEVLDREDNAVKFDDIGCLIRHVSKPGNRDKVAAWFVMDYTSRTWTDASKAWYVQDNAIHTPMGSGIVAYREKSRAESAAAQAGVKLRTFEETFP